LLTSSDGRTGDSERELDILSSPVRLMCVRLSSVCNVRAPYTQTIEIFGNIYISAPFGMLAIC